MFGVPRVALHLLAATVVSAAASLGAVAWLLPNESVDRHVEDLVSFGGPVLVCAVFALALRTGGALPWRRALLALVGQAVAFAGAVGGGMLLWRLAPGITLTTSPISTLPLFICSAIGALLGLGGVAALPRPAPAARWWYLLAAGSVALAAAVAVLGMLSAIRYDMIFEGWIGFTWIAGYGLVMLVVVAGSQADRSASSM